MEEPQPSEPSLLLQDYCRPFPLGPSSRRLFVLPPDSNNVATRFKAHKRAFNHVLIRTRRLTLNTSTRLNSSSNKEMRWLWLFDLWHVSQYKDAK
jgi:hypothetical protein